MTTLEKNTPHFCKAKISNGFIVTVCDQQCKQCNSIEHGETN